MGGLHNRPEVGRPIRGGEPEIAPKAEGGAKALGGSMIGAAKG